MSPTERENLRRKALGNWREAKRLRRESELLLLRATESRGDLTEARARYESSKEDFDALRKLVLATQTNAREIGEERQRLLEAQILTRLHGASGPTLLESLVDGALDLERPSLGPDDGRQRLALVASSDLDMLVRIKEFAGSRVPTVLGALDAGTALGLTINNQPDLAVVDSQLEVASGFDTALAFTLYAPLTKTLVLTDVPAQVEDLRIVGFHAEPRTFEKSAVLDWIEKAAA